MKKFKSLLSILLCAVLLVSATITVFAATNTVIDYNSAFNSKNLFENGNFATIKNKKPVGWTIYNETNTGNYQISTSQKTPAGDKALTLKSIKGYDAATAYNGRYFIWNNRAIVVERNTTYTISFYVKSTIGQVKFYVYEPKYESHRNGVVSFDAPQEGVNLYTYDYDNGQTRVSRTDIQHTKTLSNGYVVAGNNSMGAFQDIITADYPKQNKTGKWVKYTHTFTTGDLPEHEAKVRLGIQILGSQLGGSISFGSFTATATKNTVTKTYTPKVNDGRYGWVDPAEVADGKTVTLTATVAEGREFKGWYKNGIYVSSNPSLSFTWNDKVSDPKYEARFGEGSNANLLKSESFESYADKQSLQTRYGRNQKIWALASKDGVTFESVRASTIRAHGGTVSARINAGGSYAGYNVTGLEPNTEYAFSAYAWIPATSFAKSFSLEDVWVLPKGQDLFKDNEFAVSETDALARAEKLLSGNNEWQRFVVKFKTDASGDITIWMKHSKYCYMYLDDISVFKPVTVTAKAAWGGKATAIPSGTIVKGSKVSFVAEENVGNVFIGWKQGKNTVSTNKLFNQVANKDISLVAEFDGFNKSQDDLFALNGWDGTFEKGTVPGWYATHKNEVDAAYVSFCTYSKSNLHAHSGKYSLRASAYHRSTILPLTGLKKNTNYRFTFYYLYEDKGEQVFGNTGMSQNAIIGKDDVDKNTAGTVYDNINVSGTKPNSGWYKADFYFNTGDQTAVNYVMYYGTNDYASGCVYFDDMTLSEYYPNKEIKNSKFNETSTLAGNTVSKDWITNGTVATDAFNKALKLNTNQVGYQILTTDTDARYTVTFKAKGSVRGAAVNLTGASTSSEDLLSSVSYVDASSKTWKKYSFEFYSGSHKAVKLMFEGLAENARIDNIQIKKETLSAGGIIEKVDFESDRFKFASDTKSNVTIYTKKNASDKNVYSGNKSLKFTPSDDDSLNRFAEAFMGFRGITGVSYTVEFNYKSASGGQLYLSPDYEERFCTDQGFYKDLSKEWQKAEFHFTTLDTYVVKSVLGSALGSVKGDVYIDNIVIKTRLPLITGYNLENTYCDYLYNLVDCYSFEDYTEDGGFGKLPKGFKIKEDDDAATSTHIMTVKAGSKKTFVFDASPATVYELGVSLRGNAKTKGRIAVTVDAEGKYYYTDVNDVARSIILPSNDGSWKRDAFSFSTTSSGKIYLTIECTKGSMDVDTFMLFEAKFATLVDNNDYEVYVPYDYDNPNYVNIDKGNQDNIEQDAEEGTPLEEFVEDILEGDIIGALGDLFNLEVLIVVGLVALMFAVGAMLIKDRKGKHYEE